MRTYVANLVGGALLSLTLVSSFTAFAQDEEWNCESEVIDWWRTLDWDLCRARGFESDWACYDVVKENCEEKNSGKKISRQFKTFTHCADWCR